MKMKTTKALVLGLLMAAVTSGFVVGRSTEAREGNISLIGNVQAADKKPVVSPVKALEEIDVYYPGTEDLAPR